MVFKAILKIVIFLYIILEWLSAAIICFAKLESIFQCLFALVSCNKLLINRSHLVITFVHCTNMYCIDMALHSVFTSPHTSTSHHSPTLKKLNIDIFSVQSNVLFAQGLTSHAVKLPKNISTCWLKGLGSVTLPIRSRPQSLTSTVA